MPHPLREGGEDPCGSSGASREPQPDHPCLGVSGLRKTRRAVWQRISCRGNWCLQISARASMRRVTLCGQAVPSVAAMRELVGELR